MTATPKNASIVTAEARTPAAFWMAKLRCPGFLALVLALTTFLVFLPVARNDFVNYDDGDYVTANSHVQTGLKWENIVWAFTTGHASNWHPLTWLSHMLDWQLFGPRAGAHHLMSVAFHAANALLLFLLLRRLTGAVWRSLLVAALFALHPLHVESVAWASERKDVLSAFFWILTLLAYARYTQGKGESDGRGSSADDKARSFPLPSWCFYLLSLALFALGLMSKPMLVTLPFVLLLLDYWPLGRWRVGEMEQPALGTTNTKHEAPVLRGSALLLEKLPFFALSTLSCYITFVVQRKGGAVSTSISLGERISNAMVSYVRYIGKTFWPHKLSVLYPHPGHWPSWEVATAATLLVLIFATVGILSRKRPFLAIGWLWFFGTLIPVIGLVQVGVQSMADRYTYVPLIGLFIMLVWGGGDLVLARITTGERSRIRPRPSRETSQTKRQTSVEAQSGFEGWSLKLGALGLGTGLTLLICALVTSRQLQYWRNSQTLFSRAVQVTKNNYLAYNNLGYYLSKAGKTAEAIENYRLSLKINPAYEDALNNLGFALAHQKKYLEAMPYYEAALRVRPKHVEVHNNLGNALSELGRIDEAIAHYRVVLEQKPDHADAHNNLGIALAMRGNFDEAITHFHQAIRYKPNYASAHSNLGNALAVQHKLDEAIKEYQESLRLQPDDAQAHNNLANALAEKGLLSEAIPHYQKALKLNADNPEANFNLGIALGRQGHRSEAVAHFHEALRLKPDYAEAKRQLDAISAPAGKNE